MLFRSRATAGLSAAPEYLSCDWILRQFGTSRALAQKSYRAFVAEGAKAPSPWEKLEGQLILGDEAFVTRLACDRRDLREVRREQRAGHVDVPAPVPDRRARPGRRRAAGAAPRAPDADRVDRPVRRLGRPLLRGHGDPDRHRLAGRRVPNPGGLRPKRTMSQTSDWCTPKRG